MTCNELKELLATVNKKSPDNNTWFTSINLTNAYLSIYFQGTEHDLIKKMYADYIFASILELVYESKDLTGKINKTNTYDAILLEARIYSYEKRKKLFFEWINSVSKKFSEDEIVNVLLVFCPTMNDLKKVKQLLGLNYEINWMKEEYHRLTKNG